MAAATNRAAPPRSTGTLRQQIPAIKTNDLASQAATVAPNKLLSANSSGFGDLPAPVFAW